MCFKLKQILVTSIKPEMIIFGRDADQTIEEDEKNGENKFFLVHSNMADNIGSYMHQHWVNFIEVNAITFNLYTDPNTGESEVLLDNVTSDVRCWDNIPQSTKFYVVEE